MTDEARLVRLARRLDVDAEHARVSAALGDLPHCILKGPSTALLLGDPERASADVDVLVPASRRVEAVRRLTAAGVVGEVGGSLGEQGAHSQLLLTPAGREIDLHVTLPMLLPDGDRPWRALAPHVVDLDWDLGPLPVLDVAGRCLVLALHAMGEPSGRPLEDLRAARALVPDWSAARELARALRATAEYDAGLALLSGEVDPTSTVARLAREGAPGSAVRLAQLARTSPRRIPGELWREAFPSRAFMARHYAGEPLARAYVRRLSGLARELPSAVRALRGRRCGGVAAVRRRRRDAL